MLRIRREGHLLSILTALYVVLLGEMYTTTSGSRSTLVRKRLQYRTSPIADFGIARAPYLHTRATVWHISGAQMARTSSGKT